MCGRFVAASSPQLLAEAFAVDDVRVPGAAPSWNVAPTDAVLAVAEHDGRRLLGTFRWGLVPSWSADAGGAARRVNARAETLADKPSFRHALARRRCIVPADGFYEWRRSEDGSKQPLFIRPVDGRPLALAAVWETWRDRHRPDDPPLRTCAIVTVAANATVSGVHDRMPAILAPEAWDLWLDRSERDVGVVRSLLAPAPDGLLELVPVRTLVNDVRNDGAELVAPAV